MSRLDESPTRELASIDSREREELAAVVASIVIRGDISMLTPEQRTQHYLRVCDRLRLDPTTQPLIPLKVQGREILYPTKGAADQLAAIWGVDRDLFERPAVVDTGAGKIIQAACRATWRGRSDVSTGCVPVPTGGGEALCNAMLKAESKSKRRATLSILGLGMLSQDEVDDIPAAEKQPAAQISVSIAHPATCAAHETLREKLEVVETVDQAEQVFLDYREDIAQQSGKNPEALNAAMMDVILHLEGKGITCRTELKKRWQTHESAKAAATRAASPAMQAFKSDVDKVELPSEAVQAWLKHRQAFSSEAPATQKEAWNYLCQCVVNAGNHKSTKSAGEWLKKAIAESTRPDTDPEPPPNGGTKPEAPSVDVDEEREAIAEADSVAAPTASVDMNAEDARLRAALAEIDNKEHLANHVAAHEHEYGLPTDVISSIALTRFEQLGLSRQQGMNMLRVSRNKRSTGSRSAA